MLGDILSFNDLTVGVENFGVNFSGSQPAFSGSIFFSTSGATFLPGKSISATVSNSGTELNPDGTIDHEAMRLTFVFAGGTLSDFTAHVDTMTITLGSYLTLSASNFNLDVNAGPSDVLVSFDSIGAVVKIGSLQIGGQARNFEFLGDGTFVAKQGFGVFLTVGSSTGDSFKWPSFLPIQIQAIGIQWPNIQKDPANFTLTLSASVTGLKGVAGLSFSGSVQGIQIDPALLLQGEFPVVGIQSLGVSVSGNLFGGQVSGTLVGGIDRLDSNFNVIAATDTTTPVAHRILYLGIEGGFSFAGIGGFSIQVGLSELGPLSAQVSVTLPEGIVLDPDTGIAINDFTAGIQFYKTLPSITDPFALRNPEFTVQATVPPDQWLATLQQQVATQAKITGGTANFAAAFEAPMTITGSVAVFDIYTSYQLFNAQATVMISTDGKFLIAGQLNFLNNEIQISGKLYADLSQVSSGNVTVLFLADAPVSPRLLTIYGKLQMGFENASGQPVTFDVVQPTETPTTAQTTPTGSVAGPAPNNGSVDVNVANGALIDPMTGLYVTDPTSGTPFPGAPAGRAYVDLSYQPGAGANLDYSTIITSSAGEITVTSGGLSGATNTTLCGPTPAVACGGAIPITTVNTETGMMTVPLLYDATHVDANGKLDPSVYIYGSARETITAAACTSTATETAALDATLLCLRRCSSPATAISTCTSRPSPSTAPPSWGHRPRARRRARSGDGRHQQRG